MFYMGIVWFVYVVIFVWGSDWLVFKKFLEYVFKGSRRDLMKFLCGWFN